MNRRRFLQASLLAAAFPPSAALAEAIGRSAQGFKVGAGQDRHDAELHMMANRLDLKVSARDCDGELAIYTAVHPKKGGPPLHRHLDQDEWFFVVQGDYVLQVGAETMRLGPGDSAFAPRRIPHAFAHVSEDEGRLLFLFQPAGKMEEFFEQAGKVTPANEEQFWIEHGMEVVGPPLKIQES